MNIRSTHGFKVLTALAAAGALLLGGAIFGAVQMSSASATSTYYACVSTVGGNLYHVNTTRAPKCQGKGKVITWNQTGPAGPVGHVGPSGASGANGTDGTNGASGTDGTNGHNGAGIITSSTAPTNPCTTGYTDVELDNGEVWTCSALAWTDTGSSIKGPAGTNGVAYDCSTAPNPGIDLAGCTLTGADFSSANLIGANLVGASLGGANLGGASLLGVTADSASFNGAEMQDANLTDADLHGASLVAAQLTDDNLSGTNLTGTELFGANLTGATGLTAAQLSGADMTFTTCPDGTITFINPGVTDCNSDLTP